MIFDLRKKFRSDRTKAIIRFFLIAAGLWPFAIGVNFFHHQNYWTGTLPRVQTVDFNILSHMLPAKLSYALLSGNKEAIHETLDSNYGFFGLVITDCISLEQPCESENVLYYSNGKTDYRELFKKIDKTSLEYDYLRNPPPLYAEKKYLGAREKTRVPTGKLNDGEVMGRIYYLYGIPPSFTSGYTKWLKEPLRDSSAHRLFLWTHICFISAGLFISLTIEFLSLKHKNRLLNEIREKQTIEQHKVLLEKEIDVINGQISNIRDYYSGFETCIDQEFSSTVSNYLQELKEICYRLNVDIANIDHDFKKPPLLYSDAAESQVLLQAVEKLQPQVTDEQIASIQSYIADIHETIQFIEWILDDLKEIANLESEQVNVGEVIQLFLSKIPPNISNKKWIEVRQEGEFQSEPIIASNAWHLKSIIKNVLFNATAQLVFHRIKHGPSFTGQIIISPYEDENSVGFSILDNGPGLENEELLKSLYRKDFDSKESFYAKKGRGSSIVHSYLALHRGSVHVENSTPSGLKVTFSFPRWVTP